MNYKLLFGILIIGLFLEGCVSAMFVDFYYSPSCGYCTQVKPLILKLSEQHKINFLDVSKGSYNISGIPTIRIITDDKRKIKLVGSQEIQKRLKCELNEMTTKQCPTYSSNNYKGDSWFIK